jgi:2-(1,2-epoxy-1,2-dihydrophenyl)acetyl-CoA isomerase
MEREGAVGIITLDRPERFNSLDVATAQELRKAGLSHCRDESVRAVLVRGTAGVFCSGADLKYIHNGGDSADLDYLQPGARGAEDGFGEVFKQILEYLHSTISEITRAPKPVIAAVDGIAAAGGFGLAMACDLVLASERSRFEWAYGKTGLSGAESSTFFLPRLIGVRRSLELVLLNPSLDATRALQLGLINQVHPTEGFDDRALDLARQLAAGPTEAYAIAKGLIHDAVGVDRLDDHLDRELEHLTRIASGPDVAKGIAAFLAKRTASFAGK